jgi:hypothetical protein
MLAQEQLDKKVFPKKQKSSSWKKTDFIWHLKKSKQKKPKLILNSNVIFQAGLSCNIFSQLWEASPWQDINSLIVCEKNHGQQILKRKHIFFWGGGGDTELLRTRGTFYCN